MVAVATEARKDKCVYNLDSQSGNFFSRLVHFRSNTLEELGCCVMPTNFGEVETILGKTAGKTTSIDIFIKISKEDDIVINCLPRNQLRNKLLKTYGPW